MICCLNKSILMPMTGGSSMKFISNGPLSFVTAFVTAFVTTINCLIVATSIAVYTCVYSYPDLIIFKRGCTRGISITFWVTLGGVRVLFISSARAPGEVVEQREYVRTSIEL